MDNVMSASEAVYGFTAWLTTRKGEVVIGSAHECSGVCDLVALFCEANKLAEPRDDWTDNLTHPPN